MNRHLFLLLIAASFLGGCKKFIEKKQEEAALEIVTNGRWKVSTFTVDGADSISHFTNYSFQFRENGTVEAYNGTLLEETGTWVVNVSARSIFSSFTRPIPALRLLTGTWIITTSTTTTVDATLNANGQERKLHLDKI
ncbi:hypothetical protein [Flaviaesturariibacter amylovorans]|uniref:Lipocalin-like domain-containing protein n=1 Tax=Flaviaesturariibacter amylovorans TaxID=1084520 RepID=A0ABP8HBM7_9BACT